MRRSLAIVLAACLLASLSAVAQVRTAPLRLGRIPAPAASAGHRISLSPRLTAPAFQRSGLAGPSDIPDSPAPEALQPAALTGSIALPAQPAALEAPSLPAPAEGAAPLEAEREQAAALFDEAVRGQTILLVGTKPSRPFILREVRRTADKLALNLIVLDDPAYRKHSKKAVPDEDFIPAQVEDKDDASVSAVAEKIADFARTRKIDHVVSFLSRHAKLTAAIVDRLGAGGIPGAAVTAADDKARTREILNTVPGLEVASRRVSGPEDSRKAYRELGGGKFVLKSIRGENSRFVMLGIDSAEAAERAYRTLDADLKAFAARPEAKGTTFNSHPGIVMERFLEKLPGTEEIAVEIVMQKGRAAFGIVSDTMGIGERGELLGGRNTFPSQQPEALQRAFIDAAAKAAAALGIVDGNARVDMIMTAEGPKVIEVNPFMGGANMYKAVKLLTGVSLVEQGLRAMLGLRVAVGRKPTQVLDYRFIAARYTGHIQGLSGLSRARRFPGVRHIQMFMGRGDRVEAPQGDGYEDIGEIMSIGQTIQEAMQRGYAALRRLHLRLFKDNGRVGRQTGAYLQPKKP